MIASWMLYTLCVSLAAALAVAALDAACRALRLPTRHVWAAGMAACVVLGAAGLWRAAGSRLVLPTAGEPSLAVPRGIAATPDASLAAAVLSAARGGIARVAASVAGVGDGAGFWVLGGGWAVLTAILLAASLLTLRRFRRGRRGWPMVPISGIPVRVAPAAGPAVIGLLHPEIVVPAWLLGEPAEHQRMVVLHEDEHIRGRDPLLAGLCFALAALMPWNPVLWWLLRGMRWAAEVDCDSRVLRHDVPARAYGSLLIEMAGRAPRFSLGVSHLSESSAALKRRLQAMTARMPRWRRTRAAALGALAALALVGACEARMPTAAEIDALDVRKA
ncbi:MAG TPA: M56 family metallopeptidase, partial [Longimicrobium sp.]|nr:M56 family metallopeptidase [Longimicrobium sp.]